MTRSSRFFNPFLTIDFSRRPSLFVSLSSNERMNRNSLDVIQAVFPLGPESLMAHYPPALVTIFLGANDAVFPGVWLTDGVDHNGR